MNAARYEGSGAHVPSGGILRRQCAVVHAQHKSAGLSLYQSVYNALTSSRPPSRRAKLPKQCARWCFDCDVETFDTRTWRCRPDWRRIGGKAAAFKE